LKQFDATIFLTSSCKRQISITAGQRNILLRWVVFRWISRLLHLMSCTVLIFPAVTFGGLHDHDKLVVMALITRVFR